MFFININATELIKLHVSKNHNFLTFIESIAGATYVSSVPKDIYLSKYKNDIQNFAKLHDEISRSSILSYDKTANLLRALYIESLKNNTYKEFSNKIKTFEVGVGEIKLRKYLKYLDKLYPRFEKLIWKKTSKGLIYRKDKLSKLMKQKQFDNIVKKILNFYGVNEKDIGTLHLAFYPISYGPNINAYSMGNIESIGIFVGRSQDLIWTLSATILHEIAHTIYGKSNFVQKHFLTIKDKTRKKTINEVLATAIGAGWGYNSLINKYPTKSWYANEKYDTYAKKVYPKIKEYINKSRVIDKEFATYIKGLL